MYIFIVNPVAGDGISQKILPRLTEILEKRGLKWKVLETTRSGDGCKLAASISATDGLDGVIAVGGDGTFSEVAAGMKFSKAPMLFVPCGTGNDFIRAAHLPKDPLQALELQLNTPVSHIDIGRVNECYFLNISGTGFDVDTLVETEKYKKNYSGLKPYLLGVRDAIHRYKPTRALVSYDDEPLHEEIFTLLSLGNGQYLGGGMHAVPGAVLNDGYFDTVQVRPIKKWMIAILLLLFILGLHVKTPLATCRKVRKMRIKRKDMVLNLDGELMKCDDAEYEILQGALPVRLPCAISNPQAKRPA